MRPPPPAINGKGTRPVSCGVRFANHPIFKLLYVCDIGLGVEVAGIQSDGAEEGLT